MREDQAPQRRGRVVSRAFAGVRREHYDDPRRYQARGVWQRHDKNAVTLLHCCGDCVYIRDTLLALRIQ